MAKIPQTILDIAAEKSEEMRREIKAKKLPREALEFADFFKAQEDNESDY